MGVIAAIIASHAAMASGAFGASFYVEPSLSPLGQTALSVLIAAGIVFAMWRPEATASGLHI